MAMMNKGGLGAIISAFIILLVGIILLQITADNDSKLGVLDTVGSDTFTAAQSCVQITTGCIDSITQVQNLTGTDVLPTAEYQLCRVGSGFDGIVLTNATHDGLVLNASYTESSDCTYVADGTSRTLANLVVIFFAIGLLGAAIFVVWRSGMMEYFG